MVSGVFRATWRLAAVIVVTTVSYTAWWATRPLVLVSPALSLKGHHGVVRIWARTLNAILGVTVTVEGSAPRPPFFLACNHLSYLDVTVLFSELDGFFLAKSEIARWPVLGLLARSTGTLFVDRERRSDVVRVIGEVERVLERGSGVIVFPEGTSSGGDEVLPFRPSLFEVAVRMKSPVFPAAVTYQTPPGAAPAELSVCWWGDMSFGPHFLSLLTLPSVRATLTFGAHSITAGDRKELARLAHAAVTGDFVPVTAREAREIA